MLNFLASLFGPVSNLISEAIEDKDKANEIKAKMFAMQNEIASKTLDLERETLEAKKSIIVAEANGQSLLQRNWRPITMLTFLVLVVCDSFGMLAFRLADQAWTLLQIGLGGYVVGRSAEKITPQVVEVMKKK